MWLTTSTLCLALTFVSFGLIEHAEPLTPTGADPEPLVFIVADIVRDPMRESDQAKVAALDKLLADPTHSHKHESLETDRDELIAKYERSTPIQLRGFVTKDPQPLVSQDGYTMVRAIAVQVSARKAREFKPGDFVSLKRPPKSFSKTLTMIRTDAVEKRDEIVRGDVSAPDDCGQILDTDFLSSSPCAFSWRTPDKQIKLSADGLDTSDSGSGTRIRFRVQNQSDFAVFGVVQIKIKTAQGAELATMSFLCCRPILPSRQVELIGHLFNKSYYSSDLEWTIDHSCMFEVLDRPFQLLQRASSGG